MATPPRNDLRDRPTGGAASQGKRWAIYLGIAVVVVLLILLLFGNPFASDSAMEEDAAIESTAPETTETTGATINAGEGSGTAGDGTEEATTASPDSTASEAGNDTSAPADTAEGAQQDEEEVIEVEGDAEVEILDES